MFSWWARRNARESAGRQHPCTAVMLERIFDTLRNFHQISQPILALPEKLHNEKE